MENGDVIMTSDVRAVVNGNAKIDVHNTVSHVKNGDD